MTPQELRSQIWDDLFRARTSRSIRELAALHGTDVATIITAVDHDWFRVSDERVAVAMADPNRTSAIEPI